jgi:hypothetical protein
LIGSKYQTKLVELMSGFHAVLDEGIRGGHDDPQGFDLGVWVAELQGVIWEMGMSSQ